MKTPPGSQMLTPGHVTCDACWEANTHVDRMTDTYKKLPCPKLRLREVIKGNSNVIVKFCEDQERWRALHHPCIHN